MSNDHRNHEDQVSPGGRAEEAATYTGGQRIVPVRFEAEVVLQARYRLEGLLGTGSMGQVWKARDEVAEVTVAVKVLPPLLWGNPEEIERVRSTYRKAHRLRHPHIAGLRHLEADPVGGYFLVLDFIDGVPLSHWAGREEGPVPLSQTVELLGPLAAALDYAHSEGVIHRDVKPGNIMMDGKGTPVLVDFGIAAEIRTSATRASHRSSPSSDSSGTCTSTWRPSSGNVSRRGGRRISLRWGWWRTSF